MSGEVQGMLPRLRAMADGRAGSEIYVYENVAMDSSSFGGLVFLVVGKGCTFGEPPPHAPDGPHGVGWKYTLKGRVDLETGEVIQTTKKETA